MKKLLFLLCIGFSSLAQNITINPTGITPMQGTVHKLTYDDIRALPNPQQGDQAYDLTYQTMRFYNGSRWVDTQVRSPYKPSSTGFKTSANISYSKVQVDTLGNIYVVGNFTSSITLGTTTLTSAGGVDVFVAKYLPNQSLSWAIKIGGTLDENFKDLIIDATNNLLITGTYKGTLTGGSFTKSNADASGSTTDIFLSKINSNGNVVFLSSQGNGNNDDVNAVVVDSNNSPFILSSFSGTLTIGAATLVSAGLEDIIITRFSTGGSAIQFYTAGGTGSDIGLDMLIIPSDNSIYVTGSFTGTTSFGGLNNISAGGSDAFVAKLNPSTLQWIVSVGGGTGDDIGKALATNSTSTIFLAGTFNATASLFGNTRTSIGNKDVYIAKFNLTLGNASTVFALGDTGNEEVNDMLFISPNNIYIAGNYFSFARSFNDATYAQVSSQAKGYILNVDFLLNTVKWSETFQSISNPSNIFNITEGQNKALLGMGNSNAEIVLGGKSLSGNFVIKMEN